MSFVKADGASIEIVFTEAVNPVSIINAEYRTLDDAIVTALNYYNADYSPSKLNDGVANTSSYWWGTTSINWIKFEFIEGVVAHGFRYYNVNTSYYPKTFTVSGSTDGLTWVLLSDVLTGVSTSGWQEFSFTNLSAYKFYELDILTANSSYIYLSEFELNLDYGNEKAFTVTVPEYDFVPNGQIQQNAKPLLSVKNKVGYSATAVLSGGVLTDLMVTNGVLTLGVDDG